MKDLFITKKIFDPNLTGKAVQLYGIDSKGGYWGKNIYLVSKADGEILRLIGNTGIVVKIHLENFDGGNLNLVVLEVPKKFEGREIEKQVGAAYWDNKRSEFPDDGE